jgi:hypothetical protein
VKKIKAVTPMTPVAVLFTLVSLAWTGYSITNLMAAGLWGLLAAVSVDGLWGVVQFLDYKGIGGRTVRWLGWVALACASGLLAYHGSTINPAAAIAGALPPIVAKAAWLGDIRLRRDPTALTPGQESEINDVIRDSEYIARMKAATIRRDAAEEIALVQAQAEVTLARDEADFMVGLERLRKRAELERRRPLAVSAGPDQGSAAPAIAATPTPVITPHPRLQPRKQPPPSTPAGPVGEPVDDIQALFGQAHAPIVYFLRNGDRVKIGVSQNIKRRVAALSLRPSDVVRAEHGDQEHERAQHLRFTGLRIGDTEWFELRGALVEYLDPAAAPRFTAPRGDASPTPHATLHDAADHTPNVFELPKPFPTEPVPHLAASGEVAEQRTVAPQTLPIHVSLGRERATDEASGLGGLSKADAVRRLHAADPEVPVLQLVTRLAQMGVAVDASYVRTVLARSRKRPEPGTGQYL